MNLTRLVNIIFCAIFITMGCKSTSPKSTTVAVIGADDRASITDPNLLSSLGLLDLGDHKCNASLLANSIVVAPIHCLDSKQLFANRGYEFASADGKTSGVVTVRLIDKKRDVAYFKMNGPSLTGLTPSTQSKVGDAIVVAGFDTAAGRWLQSSCTIKQKLSDYAAMTYECDTVPGMSGSAVLSGRSMVGMHIAYDSKSNQNLAVDFSSASNVNADITKMPSITLEWPPCVCCHGCGPIPVPSIPDPSSILKDAMNSIVSKVAAQVSDQAQGWTTVTCASAGGGLIMAAQAPIAGTVCAAAIMGAPLCVAGVSAGIVAATCAQLCQDHKLQDCK